MDVPTSGVVIEELALRRYALRNGSEEVRVTGALLTFALSQAMFDVNGEPIGVGRIELEGRREFGGTVRFDVRPRLQLPTTASSQDAASFESLATDVLEVLAALCRCGLIKPACDCCGACDGRGTVPGTGGALPCAKCGASGSVPDEGRG
jgi:hypothetical protein